MNWRMKLKVWWRGWMWRHFGQPYMDKIWSPADCGDYGRIVSTERVRGMTMIFTEDRVYAIGGPYDLMDLQINVLGLR